MQLNFDDLDLAQAWEERATVMHMGTCIPVWLVNLDGRKVRFRGARLYSGSRFTFQVDPQGRQGSSDRWPWQMVHVPFTPDPMMNFLSPEEFITEGTFHVGPYPIFRDFTVRYRPLIRPEMYSLGEHCIATGR